MVRSQDSEQLMAYQSNSEYQNKERVIHTLQEAHNKLDRLQSSMAQTIALQEQCSRPQYATPIPRPKDSPTQHRSLCTPGNQIIRNVQVTSQTHDCPENVSTHIISILCNNIAGLNKQYGKLTRIVQVIHERNIDIFLGQETNRPTRTQQFQATKQYLCKYKQHIVTAETKWIFESEKKPGRTFCITNNTMRHMITQKIIDHMGRWAGNVYQLQGIQIAIISIYQTVQTYHPGFTSIHTQQVAMLTNEDRDITPCQAFSIDLMELVQNLQKEGLEFLIAGDFNAYITSSEILKELQDKCHLFRINDTTGIVSYRHGTKCLDHAFASHKLSEAVTQLHYEEYPSDYYSNHCPIFI
jgi:endonuclease/exonuclease/phosphatase family metal-dependent hydrolase